MISWVDRNAIYKIGHETIALTQKSNLLIELGKKVILILEKQIGFLNQRENHDKQHLSKKFEKGVDKTKITVHN